MSVKSAQDFLKRFNADQNFRHQIESAPTKEAREKILTNAGYNFTKDDLRKLSEQALSALPDNAAVPQHSASWISVAIAIAFLV
ncbi:MAG: Nif11-like leader peptide family natural product precursor [Candidatus Omnitrophota bacterium]